MVIDPGNLVSHARATLSNARVTHTRHVQQAAARTVRHAALNAADEARLLAMLGLTATEADHG